MPALLAPLATHRVANRRRHVKGRRQVWAAVYSIRQEVSQVLGRQVGAHTRLVNTIRQETSRGFKCYGWSAILSWGRQGGCYTFLGPSRRVLHLKRQVETHRQNVNTKHKDKTSTRNVQTKRQLETSSRPAKDVFLRFALKTKEIFTNPPRALGLDSM